MECPAIEIGRWPENLNDNNEAPNKSYQFAFESCLMKKSPLEIRSS